MGAFDGHSSYVRRFLIDEDDSEDDDLDDDYGLVAASTTSPANRPRRNTAPAATGASVLLPKLPRRGGKKPSPVRSSNMWQQREDQKGVDQSVNLMDADRGTYGASPMITTKKRPMGTGNQHHHRGIMGQMRQKSLVDIFLDNSGSQRGSEDGENRFVVHSRRPTKVEQEQKKKTYQRLLLCVFILAIVIGACMAVPEFGLIGTFSKDDKDQNNKKNTKEKDHVGVASNTTGNEEEEEIEGQVELPEKEEEEEEELNLKPNNNQEEEEGIDTAAVPQTSRADALSFIILDQGISDPKHMKDPDSAQYQALEWIAQYDPADLPIPGVDSRNSQGSEAEALADKAMEIYVLQRYALAVLYFSQEALEDEDQGRRRQKRGLKQRRTTGRRGHSSSSSNHNRDLNDITEEERQNRLNFDLKWTLEDSVCDWPGVTCQNQHVVALNLSSCLLEGAIPREIMLGAALPYLTSLDMSHNKLEWYLPNVGPSQEHVSQLQEQPAPNALTEVYLQHNKIRGTVDPIMDLPALCKQEEIVGNLPLDGVWVLTHYKFLFCFPFPLSLYVCAL
jgi:hypothetical protein